MIRKRFRRLLGITMIAAVFSAAPLFGAGDPPASNSSNETIRYVPPASTNLLRGARVNGIGGRDAGPHYPLPDIYILAPERGIALTVQEQPSIFWYLSESTKATLKVTITRKDAEEPVFEASLPAAAGIQRLNLAEQRVKLDPDVEYKVTFALIPDPKHRSDDRCASAAIMREKPPQALVDRLVSRADPLDRAIVFAREGIWYDALAVISDGIDAKDARDPAAIRKQRAALLEQANLEDVANYDLAAAVK